MVRASIPFHIVFHFVEKFCGATWIRNLFDESTYFPLARGTYSYGSEF